MAQAAATAATEREAEPAIKAEAGLLGAAGGNAVEGRGKGARAALPAPREESGIVPEPVVEPVAPRLKPDGHPGGLPVTRDDHRPILGLPQVAREIVLHLGEGSFLHSGLPNWASHDSASDLATMARTSTVSRVTS